MTTSSTKSKSDAIDGPRLERVLVDALMPAADSVLIDAPDWVQLTTPSIPDSTANGVYLARLGPDRGEAQIDAQTQAHAARGAAFRWFVGPSSTPADLPARLERAGHRLVGWALGMVCEVPESIPALPAGVELCEVGPAEVEAYAELSVRCWGHDPEFAQAVREVMARALDPARAALYVGSQRSWTIRLDGQPVGVTTLRLLPDLGYLQGAAVLPEHRGRGLYRATIHHRLQILAELGIEHAVIWANETSSAIGCRKLGFEARCRGAFFEWRPPAPP